MDWTASSNSGLRPYRSPLGAPEIKYFALSTAATASIIRVGQVVQSDTADSAQYGWKAVLAKSTGGTGGNLVSAAAGVLFGVAAETDTSDGSTLGLATRKIGVFVCSPQNEFIGYLRGGNPVASSFIGTQKSLIYDSTLKIHQVDSTNSTAALQTVVITDVPESQIGDTGGQVIFRFLSSLAAPAVARS